MNIMNVAAAVIRRQESVLICSRPADKPPQGMEFPGGKFEPGESAAQAACRELREELGIAVIPLDIMFITEIRHPDKVIRLHFIRCIQQDNAEPVPQENQECRFIPVSELDKCGLLPADRDFAVFLKKSASF